MASFVLVHGASPGIASTYVLLEQDEALPPRSNASRSRMPNQTRLSCSTPVTAPSRPAPRISPISFCTSPASEEAPIRSQLPDVNR